MTLLNSSHSLSAIGNSDRLVFASGEQSIDLHPVWLRERTTEEGTVDSGSAQRLYDPSELDESLRATDITPGDSETVITWSDGHTQTVDHCSLAQELGWEPAPTDIPWPTAWSVEPDPFPRLAWPDEGDDAAIAEALDAFWVHGFVVFTGTPTAVGTLENVATRFGAIRETNFGQLFDVFSKPKPVDLAYTPIELKAHTDNPYRTPVPGIQFLHCVVNDATGGESTLVDGLAAFDDFAEMDPDGHAALTDTMVTYKYQYGDERIVGRSPILETDRSGGFIGIRNSDRLDFVDPVDPDQLDVFYRARKSLRKLLNDPDRRATFLLSAGDVMMMNNQRLLHGRNSYELTSGLRHLQGCYIELDGPELLSRKLKLSQNS